MENDKQNSAFRKAEFEELKKKTNPSKICKKW